MDRHYRFCPATREQGRGNKEPRRQAKARLRLYPVPQLRQPCRRHCVADRGIRSRAVRRNPRDIETDIIIRIIAVLRDLEGGCRSSDRDNRTGIIGYVRAGLVYRDQFISDRNRRVRSKRDRVDGKVASACLAPRLPVKFVTVFMCQFLVEK